MHKDFTSTKQKEPRQIPKKKGAGKDESQSIHLYFCDGLSSGLQVYPEYHQCSST
jgi:hypothetical protein